MLVSADALNLGRLDQTVADESKLRYRDIRVWAVSVFYEDMWYLMNDDTGGENGNKKSW